MNKRLAGRGDTIISVQRDKLSSYSCKRNAWAVEKPLKETYEYFSCVLVEEDLAFIFSKRKKYEFERARQSTGERLQIKLLACFPIYA